MDLLAIALGGALGSVLRYGVQSALRAWFGGGFPWGTLAVNLTGSLLIGVCAAATERGWPELRPGVMIGFLGGFTTFSAFSLESLHWLRGGQTVLAAAYALASVAGGLSLAMAGYSGGRVLFGGAAS
jgi:CrcB protein